MIRTVDPERIIFKPVPLPFNWLQLVGDFWKVKIYFLFGWIWKCLKLINFCKIFSVIFHNEIFFLSKVRFRHQLYYMYKNHKKNHIYYLYV